MELSKKTTILFPPELYEHLAAVARARRTSVGQLVRSACETQYGSSSVEDRLRAVKQLRRISAPVADVAQMKRESVPAAENLMP